MYKRQASPPARDVASLATTTGEVRQEKGKAAKGPGEGEEDGYETPTPAKSGPAAVTKKTRTREDRGTPERPAFVAKPTGADASPDKKRSKKMTLTAKEAAAGCHESAVGMEEAGGGESEPGSPADSDDDDLESTSASEESEPLVMFDDGGRSRSRSPEGAEEFGDERSRSGSDNEGTAGRDY